MARIQPVSQNTTDQATSELLTAVKKKLGGVPNLISTMAQSTAVAKSYLGFAETIAGGSLPPRVREQLALVVGEANGCHYCVSAHTFLGKKAGLTDTETLSARAAVTGNPKETAALVFAQRVVQTRGKVSDADLQHVRAAGYNDAEIGEIVAHVALNVFTNYFNNVAQTEVDFPVAPALVCAA